MKVGKWLVKVFGEGGWNGIDLCYLGVDVCIFKKSFYGWLVNGVFKVEYIRKERWRDGDLLLGLLL